MADNLASAGLLMVSQRLETVGDILPSKMQSYLATGRPILFLGPRRSEIGELILANDIGVVLEHPSDIPTIVQYIRYLRGSDRRVNAIGRRAAALAERRYNRLGTVDLLLGAIEPSVASAGR